VSIFEFIDLHLEVKAEAVFSGIFLANRYEDDSIYQLYYLSKFFVEVEYIPKENKVCGFHPFTSKVFLNAYVQDISLYDLV